MLKAEYELLDAKRIQTQYEMRRIKQEMLNQGGEGTDTSRIDTLIKSLGSEGTYAASLGTAQTAASAFIDIWASDEASKVLDNIEKLSKAKRDLTDIKRLSKTLETSLQEGFTNAFQSIITGTESVKNAFLSMAQSILKALAQVLSEMMAVYAIKMLLSGFSPGSGSKNTNQFMTPGAYNPKRYGGILSPPGYATGGVARGSQAGYPAVLHGTEAVIPLPNGKSIPVEMKGGAGNINNIVVNVSSEGQTSTTGSTGPDMDKMGNAIAQAVQVELQNQKRSGGILNPYGAA